MSQENVEIVRRANAADAQQVLTGSESVRALLAQWSEVFDDFGAEVYEYLDAELYVICDARWYATGQRSQTPVDVHQADVYEVRDGKIIGITLGYATKAEALEAVGLRE